MQTTLNSIPHLYYKNNNKEISAVEQTFKAQKNERFEDPNTVDSLLFFIHKLQ